MVPGIAVQNTTVSGFEPLVARVVVDVQAPPLDIVAHIEHAVGGSPFQIHANRHVCIYWLCLD